MTQEVDKGSVVESNRLRSPTALKIAVNRRWVDANAAFSSPREIPYDLMPLRKIPDPDSKIDPTQKDILIYFSEGLNKGGMANALKLTGSQLQEKIEDLTSNGRKLTRQTGNHRLYLPLHLMIAHAIKTQMIAGARLPDSMDEGKNVPEKFREMIKQIGDGYNFQAVIANLNTNRKKFSAMLEELKALLEAKSTEHLVAMCATISSKTQNQL